MYVDYAFAVFYVYHRLIEVCSNLDSSSENVYQMVMLFFPKNIYNVSLQNSFRRERNNLIKKVVLNRILTHSVITGFDLQSWFCNRCIKRPHQLSVENVM